MGTLFMAVLIFYLNFITLKAEEPEVCIDGLGCIEGVYKLGNEVEQYEAFLGIPYAQPPIGELRFMNPVAAEPWNGKLLAKEPRPDCIQKNYLAFPAFVTGEEDCLYLNVYRPVTRSAEALPVLFYIHGGGYFCGSPSPLFQGPEYFMDTNEVILVIAAYRLGPFGFLSTDDEHMTGNFGLKDQNLAMKWVQSHISAFGGDPTRVTIFGHSSGGVSVHLHMLSPASKDLFRNAILMSGIGNAPFVGQIDQKAQTIKMANAAGIAGASNMTSLELVSALRNLQALVLVQACDDLKIWDVYPFINFRPTIEEVSWAEPFLTTDVVKLLDNKPPQTVPWIGGLAPAKGEGTVFALRLAGDPALQAEFNANFDEWFKLITALPATKHPEKVNEVVEHLVAEYMGGVRAVNNDTLDGFLELLGDANFIYPFYKTIFDNAKFQVATQNPAGIIKFNYRGPYSHSEFFSGSSKDFGTAHIDDNLFLFGMPLAAPLGYSKSSPEANLVKRYVGLHVEFAKTGNVEFFKKMHPCTTKDAFDATGFCDYLHIVNDAEPFQVDNTWNIERMKLWDYVYETLYLI